MNGATRSPSESCHPRFGPWALRMAQRIYGLALGYEKLNDHNFLRCDPLLAGAALFII